MSRRFARSARIRLSAILTIGITGATLLLLAGAPMASATTTYTATGSPSVDAISGAPWTTSQGEETEGGRFPESDLFPTYTPPTSGLTGAFTLLGGITEPNLAVYPAAAATEKPYPSGVAGTPGPLDGYCSSLGANPETGTPVSEPAGAKDPFAPYYFPDVMRQGTELLGFFDYRPKDAEEAITVARSANNGISWTTDGKALGQNNGYCPTADTNDDGQGHPYVMTVAGESKLYTLQRAAGDSTGIGLLVHKVKSEAADPLTELPSQQPTGVDANTFAEEATELPTSGGGVAIKVSTLGESGSLEHIVAGKYEDQEASSPSTQIIKCTGIATSPSKELTGCTVAGGSPLNVHTKDDLVQVIATVGLLTGTTPHPAPFTVPAGPNNTKGEGGTEHVYFTNANTEVSPLTTYTINVNAPNRIYIGGHTVYCAQANANPTTQVEDCTSPAGSFTATTEMPITADPVIPPETKMTTGLLAPDGIIGTLKGYEGAGRETEKAPSGSTVVLYTQKILNYFVVGIENGSVSGSTYTSGKFTFPKSIINYTPSVTGSEESLPATGSFHIYVGTKSNGMQELTCTGHETATQTGVPAGSVDLTGCSGGTGEVVKEAWLGGPGAAIVPGSVLEKIGEGKNGATSGPEKLYGNNEDYEAVRAAYTYNGIEFHDLGAVSGHDNGVGATAGSYNDLSDPFQQVSPSTEKPTNLSVGEPDTTELRWPGSRGTIVTNPDGSYGMFMSGGWATDGDSDAFNQIFYSSSANGYEWSVPKVVLSTDYTFSASIEQSEELSAGFRDPLNVSAYYSGRAYGPTVVQNPNGSLTMVFAGYRIPKTISAAGTTLGTGTKRYTIKSTEPALYRDILTMDLNSSSSPLVATTTTVSASDAGSGVVGAPVTYTATVAPVSPGTGTPTGTASFSDDGHPISGCTTRPLNEGSPDTATCTTTHSAAAGSDEITATYSHDSNYAASTSSPFSEATTKAATTTSISSGDSGTGVVGQSVTYTAEVAVTSPGAGTPAGSVSFSAGGHEISGCGSQTLSAGKATCTTAHGAVGSTEVKATYEGETSFEGSASSPLSEATTKAATTTSVSSGDSGTGVVGQSVTYTAEVAVSAPGAGTPAGSVSFAAGGHTISGCASETLSAGKATCTTTHGAPGSVEITATYEGETSFEGSTSSPLSEATSKAATATSVSSSDEGSGVINTSVTYTATVTVDAPGAGSPAGTVAFSDKAGPIAGCTAQALSAGSPDTATCTVVHPATAGTDEISATYSGETDYTGSASSKLTELTTKPAIASVLWVSDGVAVTGHGTGCIHPGYNNIQAAIAAAPVQARVEVCAGTYAEQLQITHALRIVPVGSVTVKLPATPKDSTTPCDLAAGTEAFQPDQELIAVCGAGRVTITGLKLEANWPSETCDDSLYGVLVGGDADLVMSGTTITGAGADPINGCQGGVAVQVGMAWTTPVEVGHATLREDTISGYQKNGITVDGSGSTATITDDTVTGAGATPVTAQNGIQVSNGAAAAIKNATISGDECNLTLTQAQEEAGGVPCGANSQADYQATGVLFYGAAAGSKLVDSTISDSDIGVYAYDASATAPTGSQVRITGDTLHNDRYESVLLDQGWATVSGDTLQGGNVAIQLLQYNGQSYGPKGTATKDTISGMADWAVQGSSDGDSAGDKAGSLTISNSKISGNPVGASVAESVHSNAASLVIATTKSDS